MHLVHEKDGVAPLLLEGEAGAVHGLADVLHPGEHGGERDELGIEGLGHEARQGGLAHPGRPPQDHGVGLAGLKGEMQGLAGTEQVALADDLLGAPGPQPLGQRRAGRLLEQVTH